MASLLEKVRLALGPLRLVMDIPGDITFLVSKCLVYFLWEELELHPSAKPQTIVLTVEYGYLFCRFEGRK